MLQKCTCGWEKVTSRRDLHIHQGRMKCKRQTDQQPHTVQAGQTVGTQSPVFNHSAPGPNGAGMSEEVEGREEAPSGGRTNTLPEVHPTKPVAKDPGRQSKIKWPKASERAEWLKLDLELSQLPELAL